MPFSFSPAHLIFANAKKLLDFKIDRTAIMLQKECDHREDSVARLAFMLINKYLNHEIFNMVPEFQAPSGRRPDLVLEEFFIQRSKTNKIEASLTIPRVFIEFKADYNKKGPLDQLKGTIFKNMPKYARSSGYLITVQGTKWSFYEYQLLAPRRADPKNPSNLQMHTEDFFRNHKDIINLELTAKRPKLEIDEIDLSYKTTVLDYTGSVEERTAINKTLRWICTENRKPRDYTKVFTGYSRLSDTLSLRGFSDGQICRFVLNCDDYKNVEGLDNEEEAVYFEEDEDEEKKRRRRIGGNRMGKRGRWKR